MKRVFLYAAVIAAALAILALCFFSPSILAKQMDARKNDVQILTASPVSVPVPENETINRIGMLSGQYEIISATEFADGTAYTRDNAMTHARDLLLSFLGTSSQPVTQELLETDPITKSEEHVWFYLYEKDGLPHSALLWSVSFHLDQAEKDATVIFDDATGSLLEISLPLFDSIEAEIPMDDDPNAGIWYYSSMAAAAYAKYAGLTSEDLQLADPEYTSSKKTYQVERVFSFRVISPDGQAGTVMGRWSVDSGPGYLHQFLSVFPGRDIPAEPVYENSSKTE